MDGLKRTEHSYGGLQIRNKNEIPIGLFCELCKLLLLYPIQVLCCGTRLCQWCSKQCLPDSEPFICRFCHLRQPKKQARADRGVERELNLIKIECYSCSWNGSYKDYLDHLQQNHAYLECSDCHKHFFAINLFEEHRQDICENRCTPCGLPNCTELVKWSEVKTHYLCGKHQKLLIAVILDYIYSKLSKNKSDVSKHAQDMNAIQESVDRVSPGLNTLSNDCTRLRSEHDQTKSTSEGMISQINETKKIFNEDTEKLLKCIESQNHTENEIDDTQKLYLSTNILLLDTDSTIIFSFRKQINEINSPFSIDSPTFKTASFGYLFELRVCSTFESSNENQGYLSIYITLLRGNFDQILFYPFPYNISLCLCDQSGQRKHIISTITADPKSPSFARPTSEKNNEIGIIKFCPLNYLTDTQSIYLRDNVFFIRIFFDFLNSGSTPFN